MEIAEEEIERTAQEAVKAAILEVGGELAFEKERADQMEAAKLALEAENKKIEGSCTEKTESVFLWSFDRWYRRRDCYVSGVRFDYGDL